MTKTDTRITSQYNTLKKIFVFSKEREGDLEGVYFLDDVKLLQDFKWAARIRTPELAILLGVSHVTCRKMEKGILRIPIALKFFLLYTLDPTMEGAYNKLEAAHSDRYDATYGG